MSCLALVFFADAGGSQPRVADQPVGFHPGGLALAALTLAPRHPGVTFHGPGGRDVFTFAAGAHQSHAANVVARSDAGLGGFGSHGVIISGNRLTG